MFWKKNFVVIDYYYFFRLVSLFIERLWVRYFGRNWGVYGELEVVFFVFKEFSVEIDIKWMIVIDNGGVMIVISVFKEKWNILNGDW